jgi:hypothetical protein
MLIWSFTLIDFFSFEEGWQEAGLALFALLISHQPIVLFSQNKPATSNQPAVLSSQNKSAPATSNQPNERADSVVKPQVTSAGSSAAQLRKQKRTRTT